MTDIIISLCYWTHQAQWNTMLEIHNSYYTSVHTYTTHHVNTCTVMCMISYWGYNCIFDASPC